MGLQVFGLQVILSICSQFTTDFIHHCFFGSVVYWDCKRVLFRGRVGSVKTTCVPDSYFMDSLTCK